MCFIVTFCKSFTISTGRLDEGCSCVDLLFVLPKFEYNKTSQFFQYHITIENVQRLKFNDFLALEKNCHFRLFFSLETLNKLIVIFLAGILEYFSAVSKMKTENPWWRVKFFVESSVMTPFKIARQF